VQRLPRTGASAYIEREPDFRHYVAYLESHRREEPRELLRHMFRTAPGTALRALIDANDPVPWPKGARRLGGRDLFYAEHVLRDVIWLRNRKFEVEPERALNAQKALAELSQHDRWWVRLYVAEILNQHPEFQTAELVERLKEDAHELVRQAISRQPGLPRNGQPPRDRDRKDRAPKESAKKG
jgi:hypothetical protein